MIERRVLKEREKRRVKKKKRKKKWREGARKEWGGAGERIQLSLKKKVTFFKVKSLFSLKWRGKKKKCLFCTVSPAWCWYYPYCC